MQGEDDVLYGRDMPLSVEAAPWQTHTKGYSCFRMIMTLDCYRTGFNSGEDNRISRESRGLSISAGDEACLFDYLFDYIDGSDVDQTVPDQIQAHEYHAGAGDLSYARHLAQCLP